MALKPAPIPSQATEPTEQQAPFYRFYLLQADDHIARRREDYFTDDATAISAAEGVIEDYPAIEIWCERRRVITLSRAEATHLQAPRTTHRAAQLINRNHRLLQQAAQTCCRTEVLRERATARRHSDWAALTWQHHRG